MTEEGPDIGRITQDDIDQAAVRVHTRMAREARFRGGRKDRIHDFDPWLHCLFAVWFVGWGGWYLRETVWVGLVMFGIAGLCAWLGVWGIRWRWKADIAWREI